MIEIACFNAHSARLAQEAEADRVEICADYEAGGLTPSFEQLTLLRRKIDLPSFVMIRPRGGGFVYTASELQEMKDNILRFKDIADGFVFGVLDESGKIDVERNTQLVRLAGPKPCTLHRAFDTTPDLDQALEDAIRCGFRTILTSGGQTNAIAGMETIVGLVEQCQGRIEIMPGGGVRSSNIELLKLTTKSQWFHSSAIVGDGETADIDEVRSLKRHFNRGAHENSATET